MNRTILHAAIAVANDPFRPYEHHIETIRIPTLERVLREKNLHGRGLELGAGTCWLSSVLSREIGVQRITAVDIDETKLRLGREYFATRFRARRAKLDFIIADYHELPFANEEFDFVVCDAALHHAQDLRKVLGEARRILKSDGTLIAIREPILPELSILRAWRRWTFGWRQRVRGDIEHIPARGMWQQSFREAGFRATFHEYFLASTLKERIVCHLGTRWNGILFNRYFIVATPLPDSLIPKPS